MALGSLGLFVVAMLTAPEPLDYRLEGIANPLGLPPDWRPAVDLVPIVGLALVVASALVGLVAIAGRWRNGDALARQQVGALAVAAGVSLAVGIWIVSPA